MGVKLRRGFKSEAESYAIEFRRELGIPDAHPLDMFRLANHLDIPTLGLSELESEVSIDCYLKLTKVSKSPFSAVTLFHGVRRSILYNDSHAPTRQQSDMAHELSHAILGHPACELTNQSGGRHYNKDMEDEAACLSGVLLVPKAAAIAVIASNKLPTVAANEFNISLQMMNMRLNQSGAKKIMSYKRFQS